jgi:hypothetical protein
MNSVLELIVLTQQGAGDAGGDDDDVTRAWLDSLVAPARNSWNQALDFLFRLGAWVNTPGFSVPIELQAPISGSEDVEMEDADSPAAMATPDDPFAAPGGVEDSGWTCAIAALALCQGETQRRRRFGPAASPRFSRRACTAR